MKMNKILIGTLAVLAMVIVPLAAVSKDDKKSDTVTLTSDNLIILNSEVNGESTGEVLTKATELDKKLAGRFGKDHKTPIYLYLNTPGGSIQSGLELIEGLNGLGRPIITITAFAASMGFQIVQSMPGDRLILKSGVLMSHHARGQMQGEFGGSVRTQMENRQQLWLDRVRELDEQTVKRTNGKQTYKSYTEEYDHELWDNGSKSVTEGYADRVITVKCDNSLAGTSTHQAEFLGIPISYQLSNCPINSAPSGISIGSIPAVDPLVISTSVNSPVANLQYEKHVKEQFLSYFETKMTTPLPMVY